MSDASAAARLSESSAAASFGGGGDDFAWACALEPLVRLTRTGGIGPRASRSSGAR